MCFNDYCSNKIQQYTGRYNQDIQFTVPTIITELFVKCTQLTNTVNFLVYY